MTADALLNRYSAAMERYEDHERDCHRIACPTCERLLSWAEDMWSFYVIENRKEMHR